MTHGAIQYLCSGFGAAVAVSATLLLAGCVPPEQEMLIDYPPAPIQAPTAAPAPLPSFGEVVVLPEVDLGIEDGLPNPANAVCMSAVGERTNDYNVTVLGNAPVAEGTEVSIGVGKEQKRWRCVAGPSGELVEVGEVDAPT